MANELWKKLARPVTLKIGWNLARKDARANFIDSPFYTDTFSVSFEQNIAELSKRLLTDSYQWAPLNFVDVPKGTLATRPGSLPELEDRVVLHAIVWLLAPRVDSCLPEAVYSYRLKERPSKSGMFRESDVLDLPYLKAKTITRYIDPFDPWYAAWPLFDEASTQAFKSEGFNYLVTTDIAAYFENIQLPILRDILIGLFPEDQRIVNFLVSALEQWSPRTDQSRNFHRGIPQGSQISRGFPDIELLGQFIFTALGS